MLKKLLILVLSLLIILPSTLAYGAAPKIKPPNIINLSGIINNDSASDLVVQIHKMNGPVIIIIDSPGGSVFAGLEIIKAIKHYPEPVMCVVDGIAASMAAVILESCDGRAATIYSVVMLHGGSTQLDERVNEHELKEATQVLDVVNRAMAEIVAPRLGMTVDEYLALTEAHELWFTARQALEHHVIDKVIED